LGSIIKERRRDGTANIDFKPLPDALAIGHPVGDSQEISGMSGSISAACQAETNSHASMIDFRYF